MACSLDVVLDQNVSLIPLPLELAQLSRGPAFLTEFFGFFSLRILIAQNRGHRVYVITLETIHSVRPQWPLGWLDSL